jgi:hypothetical protein
MSDNSCLFNLEAAMRKAETCSDYAERDTQG